MVFWVCHHDVGAAWRLALSVRPAMLPKHIFVSYSTQDLARARRLVTLFELAGWSVWWDRTSLEPGGRYRRDISGALSAASCVVVLWSKSALESEWVIDEAEEGRKRSVLIPVLLEDVEPPIGFRGIQSARLIDWAGRPDDPDLALLLGAIRARVGQPSTGSQAIDDAYFSEQRELVAQQSAHFVGRLGALAALDQFLHSFTHGYFIVRGSPGQGKTAFACHLVKERDFVHHFASRGSFRSDPQSAIRSLLAQLPQEDAAPPDTVQGLAKMLHDRMAKAAKHHRVILLVDAIDELSGSTADLRFLFFDPLPKGVFVVLTARPGDTLDLARGEVISVPHVLYDLPPLDVLESKAIVQAHLGGLPPGDVEVVSQVADGHPLLLKAVLAEISERRMLRLDRLPSRIQDYFQRATSEITSDAEPILRRVLGLLAVARRPLSLHEIGEITGFSHRDLDAKAVRPVRPYLAEIDRRYGFFHELFGGFVRQVLLYEDEIRKSHAELGNWLLRRDCSAREYRTRSLAYHLYHAKDYDGLATHVNRDFLGAKVREVGFGVLEDIELLSRSYIDTGDPARLERCIALVDALRLIVGGEVIDETERVVKRGQAVSKSLQSNLIVSVTPTFAGLETYVAMVPSHRASADFAEVFIANERLFAIIGDVPGRGMKSVFAARFLANLARKTLEESSAMTLAEALVEIRRIAVKHHYFDSVTIQLLEIKPAEGIVAICNGGHPYPVRYSVRTDQCDRLPVRGAFLNPIFDWQATGPNEVRHVEMDPGDAIVIFSDGLTEAGLMRTEPYGYRFEGLVKKLAHKGARAIGEAILKDWAEFPRFGGISDDVTIAIITRQVNDH